MRLFIDDHVLLSVFCCCCVTLAVSNVLFPQRPLSYNTGNMAVVLLQRLRETDRTAAAVIIVVITGAEIPCQGHRLLIVSEHALSRTFSVEKSAWVALSTGFRRTTSRHHDKTSHGEERRHHISTHTCGCYGVTTYHPLCAHGSPLAVAVSTPKKSKSLKYNRPATHANKPTQTTPPLRTTALCYTACNHTLAKKRLLPLSTKNLGRQSLSQTLSLRNQPAWSGLLQSYRTPVFWSWKGGRAMVVAMSRERGGDGGRGGVDVRATCLSTTLGSTQGEQHAGGGAAA